MNAHARLKAVQDGMADHFHRNAPATAEDLADWMSELDIAMGDTALARQSFQAVADINQSLQLLARLFSQAEFGAIEADEVGLLISLVQARLDVTVAQVRPSYL